MLSVNVPAGTRPNSRLSLRGEGFTNPNNSIVGNLILQINVEPPNNINNEHLRLIQRIIQERRRNN